MNQYSQKSNIGKSNYNSNITISQEIESSINEFQSIFKERLMQYMDSFFILNIKNKLAERQSLILNLKKNVLHCNKISNKNFYPTFDIDNNSLEIIQNLCLNFSNFKEYSDRIKNELDFKNYEKNFKIVFQNLFELIERIEEIINYYLNIFHGLDFEMQNDFYGKIQFLLNDFDKQFDFILENSSIVSV